MKKVLVGILALLMVMCMVGCNNSHEGNGPGTANIKDCYIEITKCELIKVGSLITSRGAAIQVFAEFKNNSKESTSLFQTAKIKAYQNGKELSNAWSPENMTTEVLPGYSVKVEYLFEYQDKTSPVVVQIYDGSKMITVYHFHKEGYCHPAVSTRL